MVLSNSYDLGDFRFGYNLNLIGENSEEIVAGKCTGMIPAWITHDFQINYYTPWDGRISIGVRNAGEKKPPLDVGDSGSRDYDFGLYNAFGRISYINYTQTF